MDTDVLNKKAVRERLIRDLKSDLVKVLDDYSEILTDEELKNALISITTVGWKQDNGLWRKL